MSAESLIGTFPTSEQLQRLPAEMGPADVADAQRDLGNLWAAEFANFGGKDAKIALANPAFYADSLRPDRSAALSGDLRGQWAELLGDADSVALQFDLRPVEERVWSHGVNGLTKLHDLIGRGQLQPTEHAEVARIVSRASDLFADSVGATGDGGYGGYLEDNVRSMRTLLFQALATREAQQQQ